MSSMTELMFSLWIVRAQRVVVELKRGVDKLHLLQALSYAAMVSEWDREQIVGQRAGFKTLLGWRGGRRNRGISRRGHRRAERTPRVLLIAEEYDYQVLATAKWLAERHEVDIACWQMEFADDYGAEYLSLTCVYPPVELANAARIRGRGHPAKPLRFANWEAALAAVKNPAVVEFYKQQLAEKVQNRLRRRILVFNIDGKNRLWMSARTKHAYVWQRGRFDGDAQFWCQSALNIDPRSASKIDPSARRLVPVVHRGDPRVAECPQRG